MKSLRGKSIEGLGRIGIRRSEGSVFVLVVALGLGAGLPTPFLREVYAQVHAPSPSLTHAIDLIVSASASQQAARLAIESALSSGTTTISNGSSTGVLMLLLSRMRSDDKFFKSLGISGSKRAALVSELEKAVNSTKAAVGQTDNAGFKTGGIKVGGSSKYAKTQAAADDLYAFASDLSTRPLVTATDGTTRFDLRNTGEEDLYKKLVIAISTKAVSLPFSFFENACYRFSEGGIGACAKERTIQAFLKTFSISLDYQGNLLGSLEDLSLIAAAQQSLPASERTPLTYFRAELDRVFTLIAAGGFFGPYQQEVGRHASLALVRGVLSQFEQIELLSDLGKLLLLVAEEDRDDVIAEYVDALPASYKNDAAFSTKLEAVVVASTLP